VALISSSGMSCICATLRRRIAELQRQQYVTHHIYADIYTWHALKSVYIQDVKARMSYLPERNTSVLLCMCLSRRLRWRPAYINFAGSGGLWAATVEGGYVAASRPAYTLRSTACI